MKLPFPAELPPCSSRRSGVTIVEVLTSIIVAVIGVAGVLVLIPFGIRQAQTGLDLHDSTTLAENASQEFQLRGYGSLGRYEGVQALPWIEVPRSGLDISSVGLGTDGFEMVTLTSDANDPLGWYLIDPLWLNAMIDLSNVNNRYPSSETVRAMFNYVGTNAADETLFTDGQSTSGVFSIPPSFPRYVQLLDFADPFSNAAASPPDLNPMQFGMADRIFRSRDDVQFASERYPDGYTDSMGESIAGLEIDPTSQPLPYVDVVYDAMGNPTILRRQYEGDISWSAVAVPKRTSGDVDLLNPGSTVGDRIEGFDFYIMVYQDRSFEDPIPFRDGTNVADSDRDPRFIYTRLDTSNGPSDIYGTGTITLDAVGVDIRNDEWVMLINFDNNGESQVGFYRVIGSFDNSITIDGSDFLIEDDTGTFRETFVIYLPNVVNVFKRQLSFEFNSNY